MALPNPTYHQHQVPAGAGPAAAAAAPQQPKGPVLIAGKTNYQQVAQRDLDLMPDLSQVPIPPLYTYQHNNCPLVKFYYQETFAEHERNRVKAAKGRGKTNPDTVPAYLEDGYGRRYTYEQWRFVLQSTREVVETVFGAAPPSTLRQSGVERIQTAIAILESKHADLRFCEPGHYKAFLLLDGRVQSARSAASRAAKKAEMEREAENQRRKNERIATQKKNIQVEQQKAAIYVRRDVIPGQPAPTDEIPVHQPAEYAQDHQTRTPARYAPYPPQHHPHLYRSEQTPQQPPYQVLSHAQQPDETPQPQQFAQYSQHAPGVEVDQPTDDSDQPTSSPEEGQIAD